MFKQTVQQCECAVVEIDQASGVRSETEAVATVVGLPNGLGGITVQIAVVSMWDALGGTYLVFYRRRQLRGGWFPWAQVPKDSDGPIEYALKLTLPEVPS
jgi:hypothetical protein